MHLKFLKKSTCTNTKLSKKVASRKAKKMINYIKSNNKLFIIKNIAKLQN